MHAWNMNYRTETLSVYTENSVIIILHMCSVKGRYDIVVSLHYADICYVYVYHYATSTKQHTSQKQSYRHDKVIKFSHSTTP